MDVGLYISDLLKEHNAVSLPGIGTFYIRKVNAFYDDTQGLFFPPYNEIAFKSANFSMSPELIRHISLVKNISELSSRYFIEKYAASLKLSLKNTGIAEINTVGTLRGYEQGYTFHSDTIYNNQLTFGLVPIKDPGFNLAARKEVASADKIQSTILSKREEPAFVVPEKKARSSWPLAILTGILVIIAVLAGIYFYQPEIFNSLLQMGPEKEVQKQLIQKETVFLDSIVKADSVAKSMQKDTAVAAVPVVAAADTVIKENIIKADTIQKPRAIRYEVIGASFNRESEAENYVSVMKSRGVKARIVEDTKRPKYKVSLGGYSDNEAAEEKKRQVHAEINKEAWIFKH